MNNPFTTRPALHSLTLALCAEGVAVAAVIAGIALIVVGVWP